MSDIQDVKVPRMRQARKSIAHLPSPDATGDKENATVDNASFHTITAKGKQTAKKIRSKSLGPGGIDALKEGTGNMGRPSLPQIKSILKPTVFLSPSKTPSTQDADRGSPRKSPGRKTPEGSPRKSPNKSPSKGAMSSQDDIFRIPGKSVKQSQSPSRSPARVPLRTEEEQEAAAREKERQEIQAHKESRRKSLASRRVSFAPEATLHTWNVVEMPEDSTTSSASTNSTRRASGLTASHGSPYSEILSPTPSEGSEPPSTPPEQIEDVQVARSPAHQREVHQKRRRRSSTIPQMNFNDPNELSSSPYSGDSGDETGTQAFETAEEGSDSSDSDNRDHIEEETLTNIDGDDNTFHSTDSNNSSGRLDAALQQAAKQAGTQGINHDEHGDLQHDDRTMEMADDEVTEAFRPSTKTARTPEVLGDPSLDQENVNPFSPAFKANIAKHTPEESNDRTMEMTQAVGGILPPGHANQSPSKNERRKSIIGLSRQRNSIARRRSSGDASAAEGDQTMDLTTAIGGIENPSHHGESESDEDAEDMTMEFTSVVGGVVQPESKGVHESDESRDAMQSETMAQRENITSTTDDETMDFTHAAGGILLPSITERTEPQEDQTMEMEVTTAIGSILPQQFNTKNKTEAKALMELETDAGQLPTATPFDDGSPQRPMGAGLLDERPLPAQTSPFHDGSPQKPIGAGLLDERPLPAQSRKPMASETGSPSFAASQTHTTSRKGVGLRQSLTPRSREPTPIKKPATPSRQLTPKPVRPLTPGKTPPPKNVAMRSASPKKLFEAEIKSAEDQEPDKTPRLKNADSLFQHDPVTGAATPSVVLKPRKRRSSGFGIDRDGLGSPRVSALLDRRGSIGDSAKAFTAQSIASSNVRFEDPRLLEREIDHERAEDKRRESGVGIIQSETDGGVVEVEQETTTSLKGMIESLSPQKKKLNGRKSLHVGAAKGLLGKRPVELDEDEDEDATPKKLKGREGSPVKKVKLPAPPSKVATTGRVTRSARLSLAETTGNARSSTPSGALTLANNNTTPKHQSRFKDAEASSPAKVSSFEGKLEGTETVAEPVEDDDRMKLQDFLHMTGIRFMDQLTTTKRRHTMAPNAGEQDIDRQVEAGVGAEESDPANELESCVIAGACTIPMLELYQHSCRELKSYISEGRKVAKEIEEATHEDNPPLFREYISAPADVRSIMDTQFKNVRTNARHLSKAMWYEWRMKLLDGLKEGLMTIGQSMEEDGRKLTQQEQILHPVLPSLTDEHDKLAQQVQLAQAHADELAEGDQEELRETRAQLIGLDEDLEAKRRMVEELQNHLREQENSLESALTRKQECSEVIQEAEKIRQDCRGWSIGEVTGLQVKVNALEAEHGWSIASTAGSSLSMTYNRAIQLHFSPSAFMPNASNAKATADGENAPISLTYEVDEYRPRPLTTEKRFFLQIIRAQLQCLQQIETKPKDILAFVSSSWDSAIAIAEEARALGVGFLTEPVIKGDEVMAVCSTIYLRAMQTKVEAAFEIRVKSGEGVSRLAMSVKPTVKVCYGETLNEKKMAEFLESRIKGVEGYGVWAQATRELEDKLISRGKKAR